ncbi:hypothetical protein JOB18_000682 [Solea senegalensis]|uniref:Uncharacterized protein n=1 Tax=Solea senegalensis TaxID=28829 RepID=A0AAV6PKY3_SOLSE|nr:hypothetical protein JOB18_000682 [Solea senegalensis]
MAIPKSEYDVMTIPKSNDHAASWRWRYRSQNAASILKSGNRSVGDIGSLKCDVMAILNVMAILKSNHGVIMAILKSLECSVMAIRSRNTTSRRYENRNAASAIPRSHGLMRSQKSRHGDTKSKYGVMAILKSEYNVMAILSHKCGVMAILKSRRHGDRMASWRY